MKRAPLVPFVVKLIDDLRKVLADRGDSYQDYADNAHVHVEMMNLIFDQPRFIGENGERKPTWAEGAMSQITSKLSRIAMHGGEKHLDNWLDIAGYAIIAAACQTRENKPDSNKLVANEPGGKVTHGIVSSANDKVSTGHSMDIAMDALSHNTSCRSIRRSLWHPTIYVWLENAVRQLMINDGNRAVPYVPTGSDIVASDWELTMRP